MQITLSPWIWMLWLPSCYDKNVFGQYSLHGITTVTPTFRSTVFNCSAMDASSSIIKTWHPKDSMEMAHNMGLALGPLYWNSFFQCWKIHESLSWSLISQECTRAYISALSSTTKNTWSLMDFCEHQMTIRMLLKLCCDCHQKVHTLP